MARIRTIKPEFPQSESMGRVSRESRLCFILLWTLADDAGRLRGNSRMLASLLYPYDDDAKKLIDRWLTELHEQRCITRYTVEGDSYIQINAWLQHQKIDKPSASKIPEPSRGFANVLASSETPREDSAADQGRDQGEEGNGKAPAGAKGVYPQEFEDAWTAYPTRPGNSKADAFKAWSARVKDGAEAAAILAGVKRYAAYCEFNRTEARFIKQAATFFGPSLHYQDPWEVASASPAPLTVPSRAADETARYLAERREQEQQATLPPPALMARIGRAVKPTEAA